MKKEVLIGVVAALLAALLGMMTVTVHPLAPIVLIFAIGAAAFITSSPYTLLLGFILVLFTRPAEFFPQLSVLQMGKLASLSALGFFFLSKVIRQDLSWAKSRVNIPMISLTACVFLSSRLGSDPVASTATFTDVFVKILILYILIVNLIDTPAKVSGFMLAIMGACSFLGIYGLQAQIMGTATIEGSRAALVGYLGDPNDMAMTLLMAAPCSLQGVATTRGKTRVFFVILALILVGGILSTQSRGGLLGIAGGSFFVLRDRVRSNLVIGAILGTMLLGGVAAAGISDRASGGSNHGEAGIDESAQGRLDAWAAGGRMVMAKPLLGVGFSRFGDNYERYVINPVIWGKHETHNAYIKCASETGLLGFGSFMSLLLMSLWGAWRVRGVLGPDDRSMQAALARGLFCNMVAVGISAFFLSACWSWFIYILVAQAVVHERIYVTAASKESSP
mgnify:CR=1 FL=1|jgi:O-antigen ligase